MAGYLVLFQRILRRAPSVAGRRVARAWLWGMRTVTLCVRSSEWEVFPELLVQKHVKFGWMSLDDSLWRLTGVGKC